LVFHTALLVIITSSVIEEETFKEDIKEKIGNMLMVGFFGTTVSQEMCNDIRDYNLGGVILFDYNPIDKSKQKIYIVKLS